MSTAAAADDVFFAGRDFHNFNVLYRTCEECYEVVGFTATQIPHIEGRQYPAALAGKRYPNGLPIWSEDDLEQIIKEQKVDRCLLAYSDLHHHKVMELASRCLSSGAEFFLVAPQNTMIASTKPVIAVVAVRTGCGKSQTSRYIIDALKQYNKKCVLIRHPMPYGNLAEQAVQRFETYDDLAKHKVTIEEREEYEQHIKAGTVVYAGVDYEAILRQAELEADVIVWDGGNNDTPFYKPDLFITVTDPHRVGHETMYHPGDVNFRMSDVIVINKANTAPDGAIDAIKANAAKINPSARVYVTNSEIVVEDPELVKGKRVLLVDDGPTLTHGGMEYGAGKFAAEKYGAAEIVDPRPYLVGSMLWTYKKFPHLGKVVAAMGYYESQRKDLEETIKAVPADTVIIATPMDLRKVIAIDKPSTTVKYGVEDRGDPPYLSSEISTLLHNAYGTNGKK